MIREMVPVIQQLDLSQEHAAATLGASKWRIFWQVIFPQLKTALIYGMTLTFARALGEFGAVLVIGGGVQGRTETATPLYLPLIGRTPIYGRLCRCNCPGAVLCPAGPDR